MIIELSRVAPGGERLTVEEPADIVDLEPGAGVRLASAPRVSVFVEVFPGQVLVRGAIEAEVVYACARCGREFPAPLRVKDFVRTVPYRDLSESVDLTEDVREDIILNFPSCPVCSPECRGLCFQCGADLNKGPCSCGPRVERSVWSALDGL